MAIELKVPPVGESITEVEIGTWLKQPGDLVNKDEPLVEIESDKATVEVFAPESGVLKEIVKKTGATAQVGELIGYFEPAQANGQPKTGAIPTPEPKSETRKPEPKEVSAAPSIMPAADRLLAKHGLDAKEVKPSGPGGRLLKEDVLAHVEGRPAPVAATPEPKSPPAPESAGEEEVVRMTPLRRAAAQHLLRAQQSMALLTTFTSATCPR